MSSVFPHRYFVHPYLKMAIGYHFEQSTGIDIKILGRGEGLVYSGKRVILPQHRIQGMANAMTLKLGVITNQNKRHDLISKIMLTSSLYFEK